MISHRSVRKVRRTLVLVSRTLDSLWLSFCQSASAASFYWTGDHDALWTTTGGANGTNWSSSPDFNNGTAGRSHGLG